MMKRLLASLAIATAMVLPFAAVAHAADKTIHKSYVCKYVGTPGVDEVLQTGQNPIWVDNHSIDEDPVVEGSYFTDKQGRSFVLVANTAKLDPEPSADACPAPEGPTQVTPLAPSFTDPTCDARKVSLTLPEQEGVVYTVEGQVSQGESVEVTATPEEGFVFPEGAQTKWGHTFGDAPTGCGHHHGHHGGPPPKPNPKPQPKPTPQSTPKKTAFTGADATKPGIAMGLLALIGAASLWASKRRSLRTA